MNDRRFSVGLPSRFLTPYQIFDRRVAKIDGIADLPELGQLCFAFWGAAA
jgi:hypothetical protein